MHAQFHTGYPRYSGISRGNILSRAMPLGRSDVGLRPRWITFSSICIIVLFILSLIQNCYIVIDTEILFVLRLYLAHCCSRFDLDRSKLFTRLVKRSSSETGLRRSETGNTIERNKHTLFQWPANNYQYQIIIKWSHSCTLKHFSRFLIVGFLWFLAIKSSTWCSHDTKNSILK